MPIEETTTTDENVNSDENISSFEELELVFKRDEATLTEFGTSNGLIHVVHEMTLGDIIVSTLLMSLLVVLFFGKVIRR